MANPKVMLVLFCNDAPLAVYNMLSAVEQQDVINRYKEAELSRAKSVYGDPTRTANARRAVKSHMDRHYIHFHEVPRGDE